ncbi:RING finger protein 223 [Erpetoichthys calabaricus]|uniref:RING finger protein 223 n=1 Tax=Erpetoichthys calabaricus TaxID=27687 RepID=UPI002234B996|nr:RING finger protein 223 [Erpetoichthys calabaricus]
MTANLQQDAKAPPPSDPRDLECSICFSQFNNIFRAPKMLQCQHTFCLECLARMNVKSDNPQAIQCPLCRSLTSLPTLGLPKLDTNVTILSYLPEAMQRVYSIRFVRSRGRLVVKQTNTRSLPSLCTVSQSLDVGLPDEQGAQAQGCGQQMGRISRTRWCRVLILLILITCLVLVISLITVQKI